MAVTSKCYMALAQTKEEPQRTGNVGEQPSLGVDSESLDDTMGESLMTINLTILGVTVGVVLGEKRTILQLRIKHMGCTAIKV